MPYTGTRNPISGIYETECKDRVRDSMPLGHVFPPCPKCGQAVNWRLVVATK